MRIYGMQGAENQFAEPKVWPMGGVISRRPVTYCGTRRDVLSPLSIEKTAAHQGRR